MGLDHRFDQYRGGNAVLAQETLETPQFAAEGPP